jgi:hypothetical protein
MESNRIPFCPYYKVPFLAAEGFAKGGIPLHTICVYDASGSMDPYWEWVSQLHNESVVGGRESQAGSCHTITFDTQAYVCKGNMLTNRIY